MLLAIDIGNTAISLALLGAGRARFVNTILAADTDQVLKNNLRHAFRTITKRDRPIEGVMICSVVPRALRILLPLVRSEISRPVWVVGQNASVPIENRYRYPKQVGQDRLVGAYAASVLYGPPLVVIDFGTAITFDVVSKKGEYLGGVIVPGIRLTTEALFRKTALLPQVDIERPSELIGRDTKTSILSGIFYGYGALCDGLITKISKSMGGRPKVIATGGYAETMKDFSRKIQVIDRDLIFTGLDLIHRERTPR